MKPYHQTEHGSLYLGDCLEVMKEMADCSVDSIVTDPPYELGFMGKAWDNTGIAYNVDMWKECLRVLKPGGHLLSFGGSRTYHRMACAIEDAGFEVRDMIEWVYGSGFPKSFNLGNGLGTALKPAHEPICLARKPIAENTIADNVLKHGTGGINVDGCRVEFGNENDSRVGTIDRQTGAMGKAAFGAKTGADISISTYKDGGRFPANLIHDGSDEVLEIFPNSKSTANVRNNKKGKNCCMSGGNLGHISFGHNDDGSAARFYYCAKPSKAERNAGCEGLPQGEPPASARSKAAEGRENALGSPRTNHHPTVKPKALMQYLCRLITPNGGTVLEPFAGSGTTLCAAVREGFHYIGIEMQADYIEIAAKRIDSELDQTDIFRTQNKER